MFSIVVEPYKLTVINKLLFIYYLYERRMENMPSIDERINMLLRTKTGRTVEEIIEILKKEGYSFDERSIHWAIL